MLCEGILFKEIYDINREILGNLKISLHTEKYSLCLGAGVSISANLPNWYGLLAKITAQVIPAYENISRLSGETIKVCDIRNAYIKGLYLFYKDLEWNEEFLEKIKNNYEGKYSGIFQNINVLETAEYIRNGIKDDIFYMTNCTEKEVMDKVNYYMKLYIKESCKTEIVIDRKNNSIQDSTLGAVSRLLMGNDKYSIHNVITYNYDNLLEEYLRNICGCSPEKIHSITKKDDIRDIDSSDDWNIYHVHGRIPVVEHAGEEMSESVILTESDYYREEQLSYSWVNVIQTYLLLRTNIIFIGFSGTDYNFRRIIKYIEKDKMKHHKRYIFFVIDDIVNAVIKNIDGVNITGERRCVDSITNKIGDPKCNEYEFEKMLINHLIYQQTMYWRNNNIEVIWSSLEELQDDLDFLHE